MTRLHPLEKLSPFSYGIRAVALFATTAAAAVLGLMLSQPQYHTSAFFWENAAETQARLMLVAAPFGAAGFAAAVVCVVWALFARRQWNLAEGLYRIALTATPLAPLAFVPVFLKWSVWHNHDLVFLLCVLVEIVALRAALAAAMRARIWEIVSTVPEGTSPPEPQVRWFQRLPQSSWLLLVVAATLFYIVWFSYYTTIWHLSGRSGYDLAIEDNILWNIWHGGHFFHAAPTLGPTGSHFRRHAALVAYLLAPFYAIHQSAEMVLILQSIIQGTAAIPLFFFARRRLGAPAACVLAIVYLFQPALQESNLFEAHYVKFGPLPFFTTLWLLDSGRSRWALILACVTLAVREDVATWVVLLGLWGVFTDHSRRTSVIITALACIYVGVVKFAIMPALAGGQDELAFMYRELIPPGKESFAWAIITVFTNPAYFARSLLDMDKLLYFLELLVPLAFVPLSRKIGWFALLPGMVYSLMETQYTALVDIHFQYSPHFLAFMFPAMVFALEPRKEDGSPTPAGATRSGRFALIPTFEMDSAARLGAYGAIIVGTLLCSYQYGPVFQQNTSRGGPIPYKFGWDAEGRKRYEAIKALKEVLPPQATVAASAFTVTQISARRNGYSLSLSLYDAEWIFAPTRRGEFVGDERNRTLQALRDHSFGVVAVKEPFFLAKRGASTELNGRILTMIGP